MIQPFRIAALFFLSLPFLSGCFNNIEVVPFPIPDNRAELNSNLLYDSADAAGRRRASRSETMRILLLPIEGIISENSAFSGASVGAGDIHRALRLAVQESRLDAILLKIDSPGGSVSESDQVYRLIESFAKQNQIPVYAHVQGIGASGAYYVAMTAGRVNVAPTSITGSIGVILRSFAVTGLMEKVGVSYRSLKSGEHKDTLSPFRDMEPGEEELLMRHISHSYEAFIRLILDSRSDRIGEQRLRELADGRIFHADDAKEFGLVDSVGYMEDFLDEILSGSEKSYREVQVFSYLPGSRGYNLYLTALQQPVTLETLLSQLQSLRRSGLYYLWEGYGF